MKATYVKSGLNYLPAIIKNRMISTLYGDPLTTRSEAKKYAQKWSADCKTEEGRLTCFYYTDEFDGGIAAECGWDAVDWKISHYTLEES